MSSSNTARKPMMVAFSDQAKAVANQQYLVKRGVLDYSTLDWQTHPRTWAIQLDEGSLYRHSPIGGYTGWMTFEVFAKLEDQSADPMFDEDLSEELLNDILTVIERTLKDVNTQGDPIVFSIPRGSAKFLESHDTQLRVQGIIATFEVSY